MSRASFVAQQIVYAIFLSTFLTAATLIPFRFIATDNLFLQNLSDVGFSMLAASLSTLVIVFALRRGSKKKKE